MMKKVMQSAAALALVAGVFAATMHEAEARRGFGPGLAIGTILGLGIAGAYAGSRYDGPSCYRGPRRCGYVGHSCFFNRYGERICRDGEYRCWRPTYCD